jgi:hypothetical protein
MTGSNRTLSSFVGKATGEPASMKPTEPPADPDSWEEPSGDGRTAKHQVFGVQLIDNKKVIGGCPYAAIMGWMGEWNGTTFRFWYSFGDKVMEATITGEIGTVQYIVDKLTSGKRESVRVNGTTITSITVKEMPLEEKGGKK